MTRRDWLVRGAVWGVFAVSVLVLTHFDFAVMAWRYRLLPAELDGKSRQIVEGFRDFAQIVPIAAILLVIARLDRRRWLIIPTVLLTVILSEGANQATKHVLARERPKTVLKRGVDLAHPGDLTGGDTWIGWLPGNDSAATQSFPSGHSSAAFAIGMTLAWFYPRLRWILLGLAFGCAGSRVIDGAHWPSDCLAGAGIGWAASWIALRPYAWALPVIWYRRGVKRRQARRHSGA